MNLALTAARSAALGLSTGRALPGHLAPATAPAPRSLGLSAAGRTLLACPAAPAVLGLVTVFTSAVPAGWSLDFSRAANSALVAAL